MQKNVLVLARDFVQGRVTTFSWILVLSIAIPSVIHSQYVTGPIVNALLIIATILLGPFEAVMIGLIPSTVALSVGLLPLPLAPMVPFIMIGNALFIACISFLRTRDSMVWHKRGWHKASPYSYPLAITVAALVKFAFLYGTVTLLMKTLLPSALVSSLSVMMGYPQFVTALIGGMIAYLFLKGIRKYE